MIKFFIYIHKFPDTKEVFYVGKGTWTEKKKYIRAHTASKRNVHWKRSVLKHGGFCPEIVAEFDNEQDAFVREIELIKFYGRSNDGGSLCNMTLGGEGHFGLKKSEESKMKMSQIMTGRIRSESHCEAISRAKVGYRHPQEIIDAHAKRMSGAGNPWFGKKQPQSMSDKKSKSMTGKLAGEKHPFYGKKRPEVSAKLSGGNSKSARRVIDTATGVEFDCITHAAAYLGERLGTVSRWLSGLRKNPSTLRYA